jgi:hypothetical protein
MMPTILSILVLALVGTACSQSPAQTPSGKSSDNRQPVRYVITIAEYHKNIVGSRTTSFLLPAKNDERYGGPFDPRSGISRVASDIFLGRNNAVNETTGEESIHEDRLAVLITELDAEGYVIGARGNRVSEKTITDADGRFIAKSARGKSKQAFVLGHWLTDFVSEPPQITPTLCDGREMPTAINKKDSAYRYSARTDPEQYTRGTFGCREWGYQLYDQKRPYIDVTSYLRTPWIHNFIGWARTGDKKPVIGLRRETWMCLFDCPNGEQPGTIPDIAVWATRNGWEAPRRPQKMPLFPDPAR